MLALAIEAEIEAAHAPSGGEENGDNGRFQRPSVATCIEKSQESRDGERYVHNHTTFPCKAIVSLHFKHRKLHFMAASFGTSGNAGAAKGLKSVIE
jgi:hypothetical protein